MKVNILLFNYDSNLKFTNELIQGFAFTWRWVFSILFSAFGAAFLAIHKQ